MYKGKIGSNLKQIREQKKITQRELSEGMNCSEVHISNLERSMTNPSTKTIINMANSLNVPLSSIVMQNAEKDEGIEKYRGIFGELNSARTMYVLKMVYEIRKVLFEYKNESEQKCEMVEEEIDYKTLGENIEQLREERNISRSIMAKRMGMNEGTYRNIENNNGRASMDKYMEIAEELNVPIDYLFNESIINKEMVSMEYIRKIFEGTDDREKQVLKEISQIIYKILKGHDM